MHTNPTRRRWKKTHPSCPPLMECRSTRTEKTKWVPCGCEREIPKTRVSRGNCGRGALRPFSTLSRLSSSLRDLIQMAPCVVRFGSDRLARAFRSRVNDRCPLWDSYRAPGGDRRGSHSNPILVNFATRSGLSRSILLDWRCRATQSASSRSALLWRGTRV
jgi:hypothetical protein